MPHPAFKWYLFKAVVNSNRSQSSAPSSNSGDIGELKPTDTLPESTSPMPPTAVAKNYQSLTAAPLSETTLVDEDAPAKAETAFSAENKHATAESTSVDNTFFPILLEQDLSGVQEIIVEEVYEEANEHDIIIEEVHEGAVGETEWEEVMDNPMPDKQGPVQDPLAEHQSDDQFEGWTPEQVEMEAAFIYTLDRKEIGIEAAWIDTLERIDLTDPHHAITTLTLVQVNEMKGSELAGELKARGLATSGKKSELINRLELALQTQNPSERNEDKIELQAGVYDRVSSTEDIGIIMKRKMNKTSPKIKERNQKILDLLATGTPIKDICKEVGCHNSLIYKVQKASNHGISK